MDSDEILAKLITRAATVRPFEDWTVVLAKYAEQLTQIETRLTAREMDGLMEAGADFYRTLARAEAYRNNAVKPA
ncbi:hypothetical protein D3C86_283770 [compost metagenome]